MKAACILVLAVALAAGGATAFLIGSDEEKKPEAPPVAQLETTNVLMGAAILNQDLQVGTLSLALRSLLDASKVSEEDDRKPDINTVRFGVSTK
jgi:Flp pilus assembly protein CpaB